MGALQRRFGEQDAVVGDDPHGDTEEVGEAGDERRAVARLELVEAGAVHDPRDHLAHVVGRLQFGRNDPEDLVGS